MRSAKMISIIALIAIAFLGGYLIGKGNTGEASREIRIGYDNKEIDGRIDIAKVISDTESQEIVDNFMMIYLTMEEITNPNLANPNVHISVISPKQSTSLIDSRLWFTNKGAVIGIRSGESWDQVDYFAINKNDANYIKEQVDYQEE